MIVGPRRCFFAMIVSPTGFVFASPRHTVCKPLHVGIVHEGMAFTLSYEKSRRLFSWECDGMGVV